MRVNVYAEEMTERVEIISKEIDGETFTGLRLYLELPATVAHSSPEGHKSMRNVSGPFIHRPGDDDSAAVTFWGKKDLRKVLQVMLDSLDKHYASSHPRYHWKEELDRVASAVYPGKEGRFTYSVDNMIEQINGLRRSAEKYEAML